MQNLSCSSCGAALRIENQFIRSVTCHFCGAAYMVSGDSTLDMTGKTTSLVNSPSRLSVGTRGQINGRGFIVLGRIRYSYEDGFWDEWQIVWEDNAPPDWLEEDEGYWTLFSRERVRAAIPPYEQVRVGSTIQVNNRSMFITEKRRAKVFGSEGQFAAVMPLQGEFGYAQGTADGILMSINYWQEEIELSKGEELDPSQVTFL